MKIVSIGKFIRSIVIMIVLVLITLSLFNTKALSNEEIVYMNYTVSYGENLWQIAELVKENNVAFANKDIREIIYEIKKINNKNSASIYENETLLIPEI